MKELQRAHEYVAAFAAATVGIILAVLCGTLTGRGQTGILFLIVGLVIAGGLCLWLKQRVWILIPMFWSLTGQIRELPLPFAVRDLIVAGVFTISLVFIALKIIRGKPQYQLVDLVLGAILVYLFTVFIRNPAGVEALNSQRVGGKPYFNVFIAMLAYWVLSRVSLSPREGWFFPILLGIGGMINSVLHAITVYFPVAAPWMSRFYSGVAVETFMTEGYLPEEMRQTYYAGGSVPLLAFFSYFRPIKVFNPLGWLFIPTVLCCIAVMLSGFRSLVFAIGVYFCIASYVRTGWRDIIRCAMIGVPLIGFLLLGQGRLFSLPHYMQRSLSFLPGAWSAAAKIDAQASSEWRFYMWKIMLTEDKYIDNKWFGDGFGFSRREYAIMQRMSITTDVSGDQESVMIMGGVHSGPISTIRTIGVVGLVAYAVFMVLFARFAWRLIRQSQNTPFLPMALFIGIPVVYEPFAYFFVFGGFEGSLPNSIFTLGLLNMLRNSLQRAPAAVANMNSRDRKSAPLQRRPIHRGLGDADSDLMPVGSGKGRVWQPRRP